MNRSREEVIQDMQKEVDRFKDSLDQLMIHIRRSNFTIERIDRNAQTLRENSSFLDNIISIGFGTELEK